MQNKGTKIILFHITANIDTAWYLTKSSHLLFIISLLLICLSKEKVEDEMIASMRLKAVGITAYAFFVLFLIAIITLGLRLYLFFWDDEGYLPEFISELFLIVLPVHSACIMSSSRGCSCVPKKNRSYEKYSEGRKGYS